MCNEMALSGDFSPKSHFGTTKAYPTQGIALFGILGTVNGPNGIYGPGSRQTLGHDSTWPRECRKRCYYPELYHIGGVDVGNRVVYFVKRPTGMVTQEVFEVREEPIPEVADPGDLLVESVYASVDPYMRGRMSERKSYTAPFTLNRPMQGGMIGRVVQTRSGDVEVGSLVFGVWPWADYWVVPQQSVRVLDPNLPPTTALGVLGLTGLTAYIGLTKFGMVRSKERLVVSAAAGGVGSLAGQIGRLLGLHVVGVAGGQQKCQWLVSELGFDAAVDYKAAKFPETFADVAGGVDVYFDNVGGVVSDVVMGSLNPHARIVVCGQIALYNQDRPVHERSRFADLLTNRATAVGFIVGEHQDAYPHALKQLSQWYRSGQLKSEEHIVRGFEELVPAFLGLFEGTNRGKLIVKLG